MMFIEEERANVSQRMNEYWRKRTNLKNDIG